MQQVDREGKCPSWPSASPCSHASVAGVFGSECLPRMSVTCWFYSSFV